MWQNKMYGTDLISVYLFVFASLKNYSPFPEEVQHALTIMYVLYELMSVLGK